MYKQSQAKMMVGDKGGYRQINKTLNICAFEDYLEGQTANLCPLPDIEELSPRVLRVLGQNPGKFTLQGTNTYVVGTGTYRLLIDTSGGEAEWVALIKETLAARGIVLSYVLITHFHGDHSGGAPVLVRMYPALEHSIYKHEPENLQQPITNGQTFVVEGATVRSLHVPGHSTDHMCFILEEERAMFTGDNILGHGSSAIEDLATFTNSLQTMLDQGCTTGYPGHGAVIPDLNRKVKAELATKLRRERQVLRALDQLRGRGERSALLTVIVREIYGDSLDEQTRITALEPFVDEVLRKLLADEKVAFERKAGTKRWFSMERGTIIRAKTAPAVQVLSTNTLAV